MKDLILFSLKLRIPSHLTIHIGILTHPRKSKKPNPISDINFGSWVFAFSLDIQFYTWDLN
jgi:hypothetical protein